MRLTERHCGVAVIKDKTKHKQAMDKLAKYEDEEEKKEMPRMGMTEYIMQRFIKID